MRRGSTRGRRFGGGRMSDLKELAEKVSFAGIQICATFGGAILLTWLNHHAWNVDHLDFWPEEARFLPAIILVFIIVISSGSMPRVGPIIPDHATSVTGPGVRSVLLALNGAVGGVLITATDRGDFGPEVFGVSAIVISSTALIVSWNILKIKNIARESVRQSAFSYDTKWRQMKFESHIADRCFARNEFYDLIAGYFLLSGFVALILVMELEI